MLQEHKKVLSWVVVFGKSASRTAVVTIESLWTESVPGPMTWPRYSTLSWKKKHLLYYNLTPALPRMESTWSRWPKWFSSLDYNTIT